MSRTLMAHQTYQLLLSLLLCCGVGSCVNLQVCSVMSQVVRALVYMHETAMICHRDLKVLGLHVSQHKPFLFPRAPSCDVSVGIIALLISCEHAHVFAGRERGTLSQLQHG